MICPTLVTQNPWQELNQFTSARIALGRAGNSIPTDKLLAFQLDHARAIDAVHNALETKALVAQFSTNQTLANSALLPPYVVTSKARDRMIYLQRPDLGRQLNDDAWQQLQSSVPKATAHKTHYDLVIVVADGLSASAIHHHALAVIERLVNLLFADKTHDWSVAPLTFVTQGRVAIGDDVGECLNADITMILIGERPGLTSPDSMGIYLTWAAKRGAKDSQRNCISNIRPEGLNYDDASQKAFYLLKESQTLKLSGVGLKDRTSSSDVEASISSNSPSHFLTPTEK
nr:ethanolamine ammonia-lyase subunit EutC [Echinimonas agarilytica]